MLSNQLKRLRENIKLTQSELSKIVEIDQTMISKHENMERPLTQRDILAYAKVFKCETHELFMDTLLSGEIEE